MSDFDFIFGAADLARLSATGTASGADANQKAGHAEQLAGALERRVNAQALAIQAIWEIVRDQNGLTDDVVRAKIAEIDLRDGQLDGKMRGHVMACAGCGRAINSAKPKCMFCGHVTDAPHIV